MSPCLLSVSLFILGFTITKASESPCYRFPEGSIVNQPPSIVSASNSIDVEVAYQSRVDNDGTRLFCYTTNDGKQSPTLRVNPGDHLKFALRNEFSGDDSLEKKMMQMMTKGANLTTCGDTKVTSSSTNIHFHGSHTSPTCHQDEVIETIINYGQTFTYDVFFPTSQPPGLFWYHPHLHGLSESAVQGGASGAFVVEGIEKLVPSVGGLPEQIFVLRDFVIPNQTDDSPAWDVSVNFIPVKYPNYEPAILPLKPNQRQFWRVLNAGADVILDIQLQFDGVAQSLEMVSIDGVALSTPLLLSHVTLPPARRAEFIITGPSLSVTTAQLVTLAVNTGPDGDNDPTRPLIQLVPDENAADPPVTIPKPTATLPNQKSILGRNQMMEKQRQRVKESKPTITRMFYFSEEPVDPTDPNSDTKFFITRRGDAPTQYSMGEAPAITTVQGTVEDWIIENRSKELHAFHIHQLHFLLLARNGAEVTDEQSQFFDTINVDYWSGNENDPYPSVRIRMDFGQVEESGEFVYHCHLLEHEDKGMMAVIKVLPSPDPAHPII